MELPATKRAYELTLSESLGVPPEARAKNGEDQRRSERRRWISGWWFGTWLLFVHLLGIIIPTD